MRDCFAVAPDKKFIRGAFDSIMPCYDLLNQILSFGMSERWRERASDLILEEPGFFPRTILDLGCGTGKFLECFLKRRTWGRAVGLDFSSAMLRKARETIKEDVTWLENDFSSLPFLAGDFDLVISAFTLRSVQDMSGFLYETYRVLGANGRVAFLELTRPSAIPAKWFFDLYLRWGLPVLGWGISGNRRAYRFLSESVRTFPKPEKFIELMNPAGFTLCSMKSFSFGAATLMIGKKRP